MKVFISWLGERSMKVAELLDDWLQCVIQSVKPFMSSKGVERGSLWFNQITEELATTSIGIVCLTNENKNKPWILFEAGAIAKGLSSNKVCTFLIDLVPTDLENPLAQFNHTFSTQKGVFELIKTINNSLAESALKESILLKVFDQYWPQFEDRFKKILSSTLEKEIRENRDPNDVMREVLATVRNMDRRIGRFENGPGKFINSKLDQYGNQWLEYETEIGVNTLFIEKGMPESEILNLIDKSGFFSGIPKWKTRKELRQIEEENEKNKPL